MSLTSGTVPVRFRPPPLSAGGSTSSRSGRQAACLVESCSRVLGGDAMRNERVCLGGGGYFARGSAGAGYVGEARKERLCNEAPKLRSADPHVNAPIIGQALATYLTNSVRAASGLSQTALACLWLWSAGADARSAGARRPALSETPGAERPLRVRMAALGKGRQVCEASAAFGKACIPLARACARERSERLSAAPSHRCPRAQMSSRRERNAAAASTLAPASVARSASQRSEVTTRIRLGSGSAATRRTISSSAELGRGRGAWATSIAVE